MSVQSLAGKVVVLTGASSGIGEAIAKHLASSNVSLVLGARREQELGRVVKEIEGDLGTDGGRAPIVWRATDVTKQADVAALVDLAKKTFGHLDAMISNAGIAWVEPMETVNVGHWNEMIDVNVRGVLHGIAAALPVFLEQEKGVGHFITILSTSGVRIAPMQAVYAGTKNCVRTILESFRQESRGRYKVTEISPGLTKTNFGSQMEGEIVEAARKRMDDVGISPMAIARAVAYALAQSDEVDVGSIVVRSTKQD